MFEQDIGDYITRTLTLHYDTVVRCAYLRLGNIHDAEDAAQDVFVSLMTAKKRPTSDEHTKAWLLRAVINRSVDILRMKNRRAYIPYDDELDGESTDEGGLESGTSALEAVMTLPEHQRDAVYLYYYEDMSIAEIAKITERKVSTVGSDLQRARKRLSIILKEEL